jgi:hypothetical protein
MTHTSRITVTDEHSDAIGCYAIVGHGEIAKRKYSVVLVAARRTSGDNYEMKLVCEVVVGFNQHAEALHCATRLALRDGVLLVPKLLLE